MKKLRKAIAIDFDGCLCSDEWPDIGEPNWSVINAAKREKEAGAGLILWTCRNEEDTQRAVEACREWGLEFDAVNASLPEWVEALGNDCRKVGANEYWDDNAIRVGAGCEPREVIALEDIESLIVGITSLIGKYRKAGVDDVGFSATHLRMMLRKLEGVAYEATKIANTAPVWYYKLRGSEKE